MTEVTTTTTKPIEKSPLQIKWNRFLENAGEKALDYVSEKWDISLDKSETIQQKLDQINVLLKDPLIREKLGYLAKDAILLLKVGEPVLIEFIGKTGNIVSKTIPKIMDDFINIGLNTLEAVPFISVIVGLLRDIDKGSHAVTSATEAWADISRATTDAIHETSETFNQIKNTKSESASEPQPAFEPESASEPQPAFEPETASEPQPAFEPQPASEPQPVSEPQPAFEPEPASEPETESTNNNKQSIIQPPHTLKQFGGKGSIQFIKMGGNIQKSIEEFISSTKNPKKILKQTKKIKLKSIKLKSIKPKIKSIKLKNSVKNNTRRKKNNNKYK